MEIFQHEIDAGLQEKILSDTAIAFVLDVKKVDENEEVLKAVASQIDNFPKQIDLFYFESVLASVGRNANDDIFLKSELWKAKSTPINKKINYMHDEKDIIGHMITSQAINRENQLIPYSTMEEELPEMFHISVGGVLYKLWEDKALQDRMDTMIRDLSTGRWNVSMECVYPHFDYGIQKDNEDMKVVPRNQSTAFLSKYLKRYGGSGKFEDYRIGRVLRDMVFSGKGMIDSNVAKQANPHSVVIKTESVIKTENKVMAEYTEAQVNELKTQLEQAKAALKANSEQEKAALQATITQLEKDKANLASELSASKEVVKAHENKVSTLTTEITSVKSDLTKANEQLAALNLESLKTKRLAMFAGFDVEPTKAQELVNKFVTVSDEAFAELVNAMPKKSTATTEIVTDPMKTAVVTDPAVPALPAGDKIAETRSNASAWFSGVFKSKAKTENK